MSKPKRPRIDLPSMLGGEQRINKLLAAAGLGSRRQVDELITDGRVEIDGKTVTQVGIKVDAEKCKISVDGEPLRRHRPLYFAVNKPAGVLCTNRDPEGRPRVIDLVPGNNRLFPVGRLDASSTGLILLTNDGELAQRLAHPRHSVPKNYFVVVAGQVDMDSMRRLQRGIYLAEGLARVDGAKIRRVRKGCTEIEITLSEGKNREIRRVLARLGHRVVTLRRLAIGPLRLATLPEGSFRPLTPDEVSALYQAVDDIKREKKADRKERDKRRSVEMNGIEPGSVPEESSQQSVSGEFIRPKKKTQKPQKKSKSPGTWEEQADELIERLPSINENPYRQEDDDDNVIDPGYEDAVLVRDTGPAMEPGNRRGKVLGYSEDESDAISSQGDEFDEDEFDSTGMGVMSFDDEGDDSDDDVDEASADDFIASLADDDEDEFDDESDDESDVSEDSEAPPPVNSPWNQITRRPRPRTDVPRRDGRAVGGRNDRSNNVRANNDRSNSDRPRRGAGDRSASDRPVRRESSSGGDFPIPSGGVGGGRQYPPRRGRGRPAARGSNDTRHESSGHSTGATPTGDGYPIVNRRERGEGRGAPPRRSSGSDGSSATSRPTTNRPTTNRPTSGGRGFGRRSTGTGGTGPYGERSSGTGNRSSGPRTRGGFGGNRSSGPSNGPRESAGGGDSAGRDGRSRSGGRPFGAGTGKRATGKRAGGKPFGGPKGRKGGGKGRPSA